MRRLNVALTRAKHKLILIGHKETISNYSTVRQLLGMLRADQIITPPSSD